MAVLRFLMRALEQNQLCALPFAQIGETFVLPQ
jgi:hypothetical protein